LLVSLLIIFFALLAVKIDGMLNWPWTATLSPLFAVDVGVLIVLAKQRQPRIESEDEDKSEAKAAMNTAKLFIFVTFMYVSIFTLLHLLIALKLDMVLATSSWAMIFVPWYLMEIFHASYTSMTMGSKLREHIYDAPEEAGSQSHPRILKTSEKVSTIFWPLWNLILRILFCVLLVLKLTSPESITWITVFTPFWLWGAVNLITMVISYGIQRRSGGRTAELMGQFALFILLAGFVYTGVGMLLQRLESMGSTPSSPVILIPIFTVLALLFCCFCCCLPMVVHGARMDLEEELRKGTELAEIVPVGRRINQAVLLRS
jgi:hypothetical protein